MAGQTTDLTVVPPGGRLQSTLVSGTLAASGVNAAFQLRFKGRIGRETTG